jgi:hypothetical protein
VGDPRPYIIEVSANEGKLVHVDFYPQPGKEAISYVFEGGGPGSRQDLMGFGSMWEYGGEGCTLEYVLADVRNYARQRHKAGAGHSGQVIVVNKENTRKAGSGGGQAPSESEGNDGVCKARRFGDAEDGVLYKAPRGTIVIEAWQVDGRKPSINGEKYGSVRMVMETPFEPGKAIPRMNGAAWLYDGDQCNFAQVIDIEREKDDSSPIVIVSPNLKINK